MYSCQAVRFTDARVPLQTTHTQRSWNRISLCRPISAAPVLGHRPTGCRWSFSQARPAWTAANARTNRVRHVRYPLKQRLYQDVCRVFRGDTLKLRESVAGSNTSRRCMMSPAICTSSCNGSCNSAGKRRQLILAANPDQQLVTEQSTQALQAHRSSPVDSGVPARRHA